MSFFEGDTRKGEQPAPPPRALTPVEIGVIIGTITVFVGVVGTLFYYRTRRAKKRRGENGERVDDGDDVDDDDEEHRVQGPGHSKNDDASSRGEDERRVTRPSPPPPPPPRTLPPRKKRIWDPYEGPKIEEADGNSPAPLRSAVVRKNMTNMLTRSKLREARATKCGKA
ncbi:hypothetical protein ColKHC_06344 [Colletotrichum higginsianum]|nr:hypothetical protein ColKHC_06344 [Colletotrichum higginsianum]